MRIKNCRFHVAELLDVFVPLIGNFVSFLFYFKLMDKRFFLKEIVDEKNLINQNNIKFTIIF